VRPDLADGVADRTAFGGAQIVHDDDVARRQRRQQDLLDIGKEAFAVDGAIDDAGRVDAVPTQRRRNVSVFQWPWASWR
jgi:hypothetical protein